MAQKRRYAVQVLYTRSQGNDQVPMLIEWLRHASIVSQVRETADGEGFTFRIHAPTAVDKSMTETWATTQAERIRSFGYNAEVVPEAL